MIRVATRYQPPRSAVRSRSRKIERPAAPVTRDVGQRKAVAEVARHWAEHVESKPSLKPRIDSDRNFAATMYRAWIGKQGSSISTAVAHFPTFSEICEELKRCDERLSESTSDSSLRRAHPVLRPRSASPARSESLPLDSCAKSTLRLTRRANKNKELDTRVQDLFASIDAPCARNQWIEGKYTIVSDSPVPVHSKVARSRDHSVGHLDMGCVVDVQEIAPNLVDGRIRARIHSPAGWISLYNSACGRHYAVSQDELVSCWLAMHGCGVEEDDAAAEGFEEEQVTHEEADKDRNGFEDVKIEEPDLDVKIEEPDEDDNVEELAEDVKTEEPDEGIKIETADEDDSLPVQELAAETLTADPISEREQEQEPPWRDRHGSSWNGWSADDSDPRILLGRWQGERNRQIDSYSVYQLRGSWLCNREGCDSKRFPLKWDERTGKMQWGRNYFCIVSDIASSGRVEWYRCTDYERQKPCFVWTRCTWDTGAE